MALDKLFEKLNISEEIVEAFKADKFPEGFDPNTAVQKYKESIIDYYKTTEDYKNVIESVRTKTYTGSQLKAMKDLNKELELGYTNSQLEDIADYSKFIIEVKRKIKEKEESLIKLKDKDILEELNTYKGKTSEYKTQLENIQEEIDNVKENERKRADAAIENALAQNYFLDMVNKDNELKDLNVPGKDFAINAIQRDIFANYKVYKDGTIKALDGTDAAHPEKDIIIKNIEELYQYYKEKAGLVKVSNGGQGGGTFIINGKPVFKGKGADNAAAKLKSLQSKRMR